MTEIKPWDQRVADDAPFREMAIHNAKNAEIAELRAALAKVAADAFEERERILDGIDVCPGLTMDQDRWLSDMVRSTAKSQPVEQKKCGNTSCAKTDANGGVHDCWYPDCLTEGKPTAATVAAVLPNGSTASNVYEAYAEGLKAGAQPVEQGKPVAPYLLNGTRFKMAFFTNGLDRSPINYVTCFSNFAEQLDGRWVALVAAEDDQHLKAHPVRPINIPNLARMMANRSADECGIDREDNWKTYGDSFIEDATAIVEHIKGATE